MSVKLLRSLKRRFGWSKVSIQLEENYPDIVEPEFRAALELCRSASMGSVERLYSVYTATRYAVASGVPGALVECGVWKGGSVMMMASALLGMGVRTRDIYLFDTFEGMTPLGEKDIDHAGDALSKMAEEKFSWLRVGIDEVRANMVRTDYPAARLHFVKGDVIETIPAQAPGRIALLRLDTDWYESTHHELEHLFPRLAPRGVLIIDDYGQFQGARQAVDEYLARQKEKYLLQRIDYTARMLIKA